MTKINRISIHGFKSFAHKTDIPFSNQFNCILGPNGSGKSNIGDAICFVLGRLSAKSLRAEKAANLIFNGGKKKTPAPKASVEIAFCNKSKVFPVPEEEIVVNRTIAKNGNSIYRINGKKYTRTEVLDLLASAKVNPEGYNIILQGDITRFVDMSHLDRRKILEEISDVSAYEDKKHKANLELEKVDEKLNNAEIILIERSTYLKELKKDRDQALKFKELKDRIDAYKATNLHLQIEEKEKLRGKADEEANQHKSKVESAEKKVLELNHQIKEKKNQIGEINKEIEQKGEKEQLKIHGEIEDLKVNLAESKTRISTLKDEINKIQQRKDQFNQELTELEEKSSSSLEKQKDLGLRIKSKTKDLEELERQIGEFKKKHKIESSHQIEEEIESKDKLIEQKQEEVQKIRQEQQELLREKDKLEFQLASIEDKIKKVKEVEKESQGQLKELQKKKSDFKSATLRLNQCLDTDSSFASQISHARKNTTSLQERQAALQAKAYSIQYSSNKAVESIKKSKIKGVYGTISELGQVKKKYALALEMSASNRMQYLVVDNDQTAADCIKHLKNSQSGSASFIPLNKVKSSDLTTEDKKFLGKEGVHDFAMNLVSFKPQFQKAFSYVFGKTLIVENIDTARKLGIGTIKMATLDGNIAESSGIMKGGFIKQSGAGFQEKDSLEELEKVEGELAELQGVISSLETKRAANEQEINSLRNLKGELEGEVIKLEKVLHLEDSDLTATNDFRKEAETRLNLVNSKLNKIQQNIISINKDLTELKTNKQNLRLQVSQLRDPRLLAQLSAFEESKQKNKEELIHLENELKNSLGQIKQLIAPEREKINEILKQHKKEGEQFLTEIQTLSEKVKIKDKELVDKEKESKEFYSKYRALFSQREKLGGEVGKTENDIENIREKMRSSEREMNLVSLKNAEVKAKLAALQEEFNRYKNAEILTNKSPEELQSEIHKFEVMLGQMSAVNMKALEVYEQVETEFNALMDKKNCLDKEKIDVMTLMNEIETKKKDHFMKTFYHANENFQRIFTSLFKKGKAYLQLDNPNKPFDDGLSVKVKLTSNRYMDIKSLSGGEKTLTALSFIFAIQEYQPASFYILDEIDAALDKHNSETLAKLIRNYSNKAQYVVISHNDSLIAEADNLYGVSMNEDGISKVTSLKI